MKSVEFYTGTNCVELCYSGYNWMTSLYVLNEEAKKLQTDARRICKSVGIHNESNDYNVHVVFPEHKIFVSLGDGTRDTCEKIVAEAKKRHFKFTIGNKK